MTEGDEERGGGGGEENESEMRLLTLLLVPGLHQHHLFVFVPRSVGSVGPGDAPRPRGGWLDTPACPTAPATVLHNGGGGHPTPPFRCCPRQSSDAHNMEPVLFRCRTHNCSLYFLLSFFFFYYYPLLFCAPLSSSLYSRYSRARPFPGDLFYAIISAWSVSVRETAPLKEGETPAIRIREHRNNKVQTGVTRRILSLSSAVVVLSVLYSFARRLGPLVQEKHFKSFLVRGYSRTCRFPLLSGQGAPFFSLSYEKIALIYTHAHESPSPIDI